MGGYVRRLVVVVALAAVATLATSALGCRRGAVDIERPPAGRQLTASEEAELSRVAEEAFRDARAQLPGLPDRLTLIVRFGKDVIPETGESGAAGFPGNVALTLDPDRDVGRTIRERVRPCLLHELHHLARRSRYPSPTRVLDRVVSEGLATAFERDAGRSRPLWGEPLLDPAPPTRAAIANADEPNLAPWFDPATTRERFVGHRVGVYLVDRASAATGRTAADLVFASSEEIVRLANVR